jgi:hypothetical protein
VVAHAVLRTPDDGCKEHPKHVEKPSSKIKYRLLSAASRWKLIYMRLAMHGTMNVKSWSMPERNERNKDSSVRMVDIITEVAAGHIQTATMHEFSLLP